VGFDNQTVYRDACFLVLAGLTMSEKRHFHASRMSIASFLLETGQCPVEGFEKR
jgi:hypothetical protein